MGEIVADAAMRADYDYGIDRIREDREEAEARARSRGRFLKLRSLIAPKGGL
ncbi:MAG: hypothetical protein ACREX9_19090 [Gammaproteobacteria bacterium]